MLSSSDISIQCIGELMSNPDSVEIIKLLRQELPSEIKICLLLHACRQVCVPATNHIPKGSSRVLTAYLAPRCLVKTAKDIIPEGKMVQNHRLKMRRDSFQTVAVFKFNNAAKIISSLKENGR